MATDKEELRKIIEGYREAMETIIDSTDDLWISLLANLSLASDSYYDKMEEYEKKIFISFVNDLREHYFNDQGKDVLLQNKDVCGSS